MSDERLKPCPFCGGEARILLEEEDRPDDAFHNIYCKGCGVQFWVKSKSDAIKVWNTRKPMERILERLEDKFVSTWDCGYEGGYKDAIVDAIEIVKME